MEVEIAILDGSGFLCASEKVKDMRIQFPGQLMEKFRKYEVKDYAKRSICR